MSDFPNDPNKKENSLFSVGSSAEDDADEMDEVDEIGEYVQSGRVMLDPQEEEKKNPYNNPKNHLIGALLLIGMMLLLIFADSMQRADEQRIADENGLIDIITLSSGTIWSEGGSVGYYTLADGKLYEVQAFESGSSERFISEAYSFSDVGSGIVRNSLTDKSVYPDNDVNCRPDRSTPEADPVFDAILTLVEYTENEHALIYARIFRTEGEYFVCVDRNVNLWTPYVLYYYSAENDALYYLYKLSDMDIVDIRLRENFGEKIGALINTQ